MQNENTSAPAETQTRDKRANSGFTQWVTVPASLGHLHEVREIPNSDPPAFSVRISVPQGRGEYIKYANLDLIIDSASALALLLKHSAQINQKETKVTLSFEYYNPFPDAYLLKNPDGSIKTDKQGNPEQRAVIRGKLSRIAYLKVGNQVVYGKGKPENAVKSESVTPLREKAETKSARSPRKTA